SGDNCGSWVRAMKISLGAKNKLGFVDGSIPIPLPDSPNYALWMLI
ncbi:hypothetical protein A2U01_0003428, partial [Trifolium medium]|nr:hypothetical protein [Trifolium medium]